MLSGSDSAQPTQTFDRLSRPSQQRASAQVALLATALLLGNSPAQGQGADIFKGADLALGQQLIKEHACAQCHIGKVGGDGSAIYRPLGRINTAGLLRGMVEQCNTTLNLQMFPEDVTAVAAVLNRDHYQFK